MKYFIILFVSLNVFAGENCTEKSNVEVQDVVYSVDTTLPKHLKGAVITITKVDGTSSTVPAEKFMVVPRKQKTIVGQNKNVTVAKSCKSSTKNLLMLEGRKDVKGLSVNTNGKTANVYSEKEFIPGVNYYRGGLIENIGAGLGIDANGTGKAIIGLEF